MVRLFISITILIAMSVNVSALTFEEAVQLAVESDYSIKRSESLVSSKQWSAWSTASAFLPYADLKYDHNNVLKWDKTMSRAKTETSTFAFEAGINVFNGFADIQNVRMGWKALDLQESIIESTRQDVVFETKKAYISYLKAKNSLAVAEETMKLLEAQKKIAEVSYNVGQFSRADVLRVDVQLAATQLELLDSQIALKLAKQQLEKSIGRAIDDREKIVGIKVKKEYVIPALEDLYSMLEERSELASATGAYELTAMNKTKQISRFLPKVNLGYAKTWYGDRWDAFEGRKGNTANAYDEQEALIVSASWNIFSGGSDVFTYLSLSSETEASAFAVSDLRKKLKLQVSSLYENYFSAKERFESSSVAVEQARESYRVTQSQYANSEATTTDLLNASVALNGALNSNLVANYEVILAVAQIERAIEKNLLGIETAVAVDHEKEQEVNLDELVTGKTAEELELEAKKTDDAPAEDAVNEQPVEPAIENVR